MEGWKTPFFFWEGLMLTWFSCEALPIRTKHPATPPKTHTAQGDRILSPVPDTNKSVPWYQFTKNSQIHQQKIHKHINFCGPNIIPPSSLYIITIFLRDHPSISPRPQQKHHTCFTQGFFIFFDIQETTEGIPFIATSHMYSQNALNLGHLLSWASGYCTAAKRKLTDGNVPRTVKGTFFFIRRFSTIDFQMIFICPSIKIFRWYIGRFQGAINESTSFCSSDIIPSRHGDDISHQSGRSIDLLYCQLASWELKIPRVENSFSGCFFEHWLSF